MEAPTSLDCMKLRVQAALKDTFGFDAFRGVQEAAIQAALAGRDAFVLMPTGGGKSLCYALPAVVAGGLVVVVSPLIALMQDQVASLQARGIAADYLSSSRSTAERQALLMRLSQLPAGPAAAAGRGSKVAGASDEAAGSSSSSSKLVLLYVTPELLATDSFRQRLLLLHSKRALQLLAVDEAHCISSWGHDFRPKYRQLAALRRQLPGLPCLALTATATQQVQQDVMTSLGMQDPVVLRQSFNRGNIHYSVVLLDVQDPPHLQPSSSSNAAPAAAPSASMPAAAAAASSVLGDEDAEADVDHAGYQHLLQLLKTPIQPTQHQQHDQPPQQQAQQMQVVVAGKQAAGCQTGPVTIVYALKRATVDVLVRRLRAAGLRVAGYHAALKDSTRSEVLERWRSGELQVVVATVAFGMGVDKGDVEMIVHYNLPKSIESFYQESGRAGRMGQPARSVLFYATRDRRRMDWILQKEQDRKSSKKRKARGEGGASAATPAAAAAGNAADWGSSGADVAAAAAGLRAFGAVVELCVAAGCRRVRLLKHFGEELLPVALQQQQQRCCDFCDRPVAVASAAAQLQQQEVQLMQQRYAGPAAGGWGSKRQRRDGSGSCGLFDALDGFGDSEDGDHSGSGPSDAEDAELDDDSTAAVRQAAAAAKAGSKQKGAKGAAATAAFLSAMEAAEERHNMAAAAQAGAGGGDPLSRLMQAREAGLPKQAAVVPDDVRGARRSNLAELVAGNPCLTGCTRAAAAEVAAALEGRVFGPGVSAAQHRAELAKLAVAVRAARGWTQLPELQHLPCKCLGVVLKHSVAALVQDAGAGEPGEALAAAALQRLAALPVSVEVLEASGAARQVKALRKHRSAAVAAAAAGVITAWRAAVG